MEDPTGATQATATATLPADPTTVAATQHLPLPVLPLDVLEAVCRRLTLADRLSLTSCCRALWARPDVLASAGLWGEVEVAWGSLAEAVDSGAASLAAWLGRRRPAVRSLSLAFLWAQEDHDAPADLLSEAHDSAAAVVAALAGGCLTRLRLDSIPTWQEAWVGGDAAAGPADLFGPLAALPALASLTASRCELRELPHQLSATTQLAELDASGNPRLLRRSAGEASLDVLRGLSGLSRVSLRECGALRVPHQLAALPRLAYLDLGCQEPDRLGEVGLVAFAALESLASLTRLDIAGARLPAQRLPPALGTLRALRDLSLLAIPLGAWRRDNSALDPLGMLSSLTRLNVSGCQLRRLPWQLTQLPLLAALEAEFNQLGSGGAEAFAPLEHATALTRLNLGMCNLAALPPQLTAAAGLAALDLRMNLLMGQLAAPEAGLEPLAHLLALRTLLAKSCDLRALPPQLSAASGLLALNVDDSWQLGAGGEEALQPLRALTGLTRLHLRGTGLQAVPAALWGLTALRELSLGNNAALGRNGEGAFVGLERLTSLRQLGLEDASLSTLPPQLGALALLEDLDLQGNPGLRRAGRGGFAPLARLASLRRLRLGGSGLSTLPPELALLQLEHGRRVSLPGFQLEDVVLS